MAAGTFLQASSAAPRHWSVGAAKELARASPTSLAVTRELLRRGRACDSLAECLQMEYRVASRFLTHPDFISGVGAVLSKGAEPARWAEPPTPQQVEAFFGPGLGGELSL